MLLLFFKLLARLPLPILHGVGRAIGRLIYYMPGRYRKRLQRNAAQAGYTHKSFAAQAGAQTGAMILETPKVWLQTQKCLDKTVSDDDAIVQKIKDQGRGILYLTPHLGCFEITARYIAKTSPITVMFRQPRWKPLEPAMVQSRNTTGLNAVPANMQGVRQFVRALKKGQAVGMLPDQVPSGGDGIWAPFFDKPAYTMTLAAKLALQSKVAIVVTSGQRLKGGKGWRIHYHQIPDPLPETVEELVPLINQTIEEMIRRFPEQYLWSYNRYKIPSDAPAIPEALRNKNQ